MIIGEHFIWLHLPKTGGTTMNRLLGEHLGDQVDVDADNTSAKHDSIAVRRQRGDWQPGTRQRFITARRLEAWLISDWQHKRRHMNLPDLDFEPVRSGLFYSLRLGGTWVAADWWLQYFDVDHSVTALRLEHLCADLNQHLLPLLPAGTPAFTTAPQENSKPIADASAPQFTAADRLRIQAVNPRWSAWEQQLYHQP